VNVAGWSQIAVFSLLILAAAKPFGLYLHRVLEGERPPLRRVFGPLERAIYRLAGVDATAEQRWDAYTLALLLFSTCGVLVTYALQRLQPHLPLNPQGLGPVEASSAFNTAASFTTNTNWQGYAGETTMSYLTQMAGLGWHNFVSAAAGVGVALALARGLTRPANAARTVGNFWRDLVRTTVYVLLPLSVVAGLALAAGGVIQNLDSYLEVVTLEGGKQVLAMGPVASQEAIKELGTNGGGFMSANSAHPFENPTPLTNFLEMLLILVIPAALTYTFGLMAGDTRQGWALFAAMSVLFVAGVAVAYGAESAGNPALRGLPIAEPLGNMEGKEVRFGIASSVLFATITTGTSCGAVNSMHDSFTPLGGLVPMFNMQLGEVIFGGVGAGIYGMLVMAILSVFIAGLMVGRTPEYLGKKVESREVKLAMLYVLVFPLTVLTLSAWSLVVPYGTTTLNHAGPHGLSEALYAFTSAAGNNGSAFAGLGANTLWYNTTLGLAMLVGRFWMIVPVLAIAGSLAAKNAAPPGPGTLPTTGPLFVVLLLSVLVIVGALTFLPALSLGPIVEHYLARAGRTF